MGHNPIPPPPRPTLLELAKREYVAGRIDIDQLEARVERLIESRTEDDRPIASPQLHQIFGPIKPAEPTRSLR